MKVSQLIYNFDNERYTLDNEDLYCGDTLKVLIYNGLTNDIEWIDTRLELDSKGEWYLVGLVGYAIGGLFATKE